MADARPFDIGEMERRLTALEVRVACNEQRIAEILGRLQVKPGLQIDYTQVHTLPRTSSP